MDDRRLLHSTRLMPADQVTLFGGVNVPSRA
jgi:hypothetical protein